MQAVFGRGRVPFVRIITLYKLERKREALRVCLDALQRAESISQMPALMGLLCTVAELWLLEGKEPQAGALAKVVLAEESTEELFRSKLEELSTQITTPPLAEVPDSIPGWLQYARDDLEAELLKDASERRTPLELAALKR